MRPIDKLGLGPKREVKKLPDGNYLLTVTPPKWANFSSSSITLNPDQHRKYWQWLEGGALINELFPELSAAQREIIMSGIGSEEFDVTFKDTKELAADLAPEFQRLINQISEGAVGSDAEILLRNFFWKNKLAVIRIVTAHAVEDQDGDFIGNEQVL